MESQICGMATKFAMASLAAALIATAALPAIAAKPDQRRHGGHHAQGQEQEVSATGKRKGNKNTTVQKTFSNGDAIAIPAQGAEDDLGPADTYPSSIDVTGFKKARITDLNLTLRGFSHGFPGDVQLLLVAPGGRNAVVMGDVSTQLSADPVSNLTITLDDEAAAPLPEEELVTSGSFRPFDGEGPGITGVLTEFPAPAPAPSGNNALSTFDGINPNGQWQLFVLDDDFADVGSLADGWTLEITAKSKAKNKNKRKR
jgi:hypothetical protein